MAANLYAKYLEGMKGRWDKQKAASKAAAAGAKVPDNTYLAKLQKSEMRQMKQKDEDKKEIMALAIMHTFLITEGDYAGQKLFIFDKTATDENIMHLQKNFRLLGEDMDDGDPSKIPACCEAMTRRKPGVRLNAKTNDKGFQNIYIQKAVDLDDATPDISGAEDAGDPTTDGVEIEVPEPAATPPKAAKAATKPKTTPKAPVAEPEPVDVEEVVEEVVEAGDPEYSVGDAVQFKMKGAAVRGLVFSDPEMKDGELKMIVKNDAEPRQKVWVKLSDPNLAKVD